MFRGPDTVPKTAFGWWGMKNIWVIVYFCSGPMVKEKMCVCYLSGCCRHLFNLLERWILKAGSLLKCLFTLSLSQTRKTAQRGLQSQALPIRRGAWLHGFRSRDVMPGGRLGGERGLSWSKWNREKEPCDGGVRHSCRLALPDRLS